VAFARYVATRIDDNHLRIEAYADIVDASRAWYKRIGAWGW
jgi:hypothetical protein